MQPYVQKDDWQILRVKQGVLDSASGITRLYGVKHDSMPSIIMYTMSTALSQSVTFRLWTLDLHDIDVAARCFFFNHNSSHVTRCYG